MTATPSHPAAQDQTVPRLFRVEVRPRPDELDTAGDTVLHHARQELPGVHAVQSARVYLIEAPLDEDDIRRLSDQLLTDPVSQVAHIGIAEPPAHGTVLEVHYQPGVMDPVAQSTRDAIAEAQPQLSPDRLDVRTGYRYDLLLDAAIDLPELDDLRSFAERSLANPVIQDIFVEPFWPDAFPHGHDYQLNLTHVPIRHLDDAGLEKLSREGHLFLSLAEMQAIRAYYQQADREPTDIELETLAQTWSEHCVHKTLKSTVRYRQSDANGLHFEDRPGHEVHPDGSVTIHNLLKSTVAAATHKLMQDQPHRDWCVSVFEDNAGIVKFDDTHAVCIKVETHNHPSAIEPYGGAATGIGGCIRDILGTGLAAQPVANTDTFCVAYPDTADLPAGVIHPKRILQQVVAGVRDYGNRMGIPTLNGAVYFHEDFLGNPLVFAGCVGLMPLDRCFGDARPGDRIIALGGATGRDGIHGATFSSAELTDTHADEFAHAVQIGNPITQKKMLDVILQARDYDRGPLFSAITDCGAGGFSSAIGEMGEKVGAFVTLEQAPLKYQGLSYTEIWISEAQERMVLSVPAGNVDTLKTLCRQENVGFADLGQFGCGPEGPTDRPADEPTLVLTYRGTEVGRMGMSFLHEGLPTPVRDAAWAGRTTADTQAPAPATDASLRGSVPASLHTLLAHPNIASKHWVVRQYDHEVQGGSVIKPLIGPHQDGPSDAAIIRPKLDSQRGVALASGLAPHLSEKATDTGRAVDGDSYWATLAAMDEAVRNAVCVGADPRQIAILDNFCWPRCDDPQQLGTLVRAAEACYDGALAYQAPFVSGKDSLSNQFTTEDGRLITIPQTMLISALGIVPDVARARTMDAKQAGNLLLIVGQTTGQMGGSHYQLVTGDTDLDRRIPRVDLQQGPASARFVADLIQRGLVVSAHDCSEGGLLVAAAEMAFAGRVGLDLDLQHVATDGELPDAVACFAETPSRYLLEIDPANKDAVLNLANDQSTAVAIGQAGQFADHDRLTVAGSAGSALVDEPLDTLRNAWLSTLDW